MASKPIADQDARRPPFPNPSASDAAAAGSTPCLARVSTRGLLSRWESVSCNKSSPSPCCLNPSR